MNLIKRILARFGFVHISAHSILRRRTPENRILELNYEISDLRSDLYWARYHAYVLARYISEKENNSFKDRLVKGVRVVDEDDLIKALEASVEWCSKRTV